MRNKRLILFALIFLLSMCTVRYINIVKASDTTEFNIKNGVLLKYNGTDREVIIPEGVSIIEVEAFYRNKTIEKVVIPEGVIEIKDYAFYNCENLSVIEFPKSLAKLCYMSLVGTKWLEIQREHDPYVVVNGILYDAQMVKGDVIIPSNVTKIGEMAFSGIQNLKSAYIPKGVKVIEREAFAGSSIEKVVMEDTVLELGEAAFYQCGLLKDVQLSDNIKILQGDTFSKCKSLVQITLPKKLKEISWDFWYCKKLKSITVPNSLTKISDRSFVGCNSKLALYCPSNDYIKKNAKNCNYHYEDLKLNKTKLVLSRKETEKLVLNSGASCKWKSSNPKIAKVSRSGKVTALKKGKTVITANLYGKEYKCNVIVK